MNTPYYCIPLIFCVICFIFCSLPIIIYKKEILKNKAFLVIRFIFFLLLCPFFVIVVLCDEETKKNLIEVYKILSNELSIDKQFYINTGLVTIPSLLIAYFCFT